MTTSSVQNSGLHSQCGQVCTLSNVDFNIFITLFVTLCVYHQHNSICNLEFLAFYSATLASSVQFNEVLG